ncbi:Galectin-4 [Eumeta japonica]|uniref:Galectin n=1 Tax=Eumeta variegata TaxID=151549 RepID=A0A4C1XN65_EUMVA|nr:Galectin-4 [Eumeta japonica]
MNFRSFAINLQCGPTIEHHDDIAFHFNVRFDGYCLVMNHYYGRSWWQEERDESRLPIKEGESFEAVILCRLNSIKVSINNTHFYEFKHRLPYQRITYITIVEDVILKSISFEDA